MTVRQARTSEMQPWHDTSLPPEERVTRLMAEMTLEEKIAQLGSKWVNNRTGGSRAGTRGRGVTERDIANAPELQGSVRQLVEDDLRTAARHGLGQLTRVHGSIPLTPQEGIAELVRQHRVVLDASRHRIPAMVHEECLTGFAAYGATVYPTALAWGATWDPELIGRMAAAIGRDMAAVGVHQGLAPVLDVVRDYRWGRVEESIGEDPHLVAELGVAYVKGMQSSGVAATLKHFAGHSASRAGRNHGPVSVGEREMRDVILPPFEAAVVRAGAESVMSAYNDIDGVPAAASHWLLTEVLREEWGFSGTVVADYNSVAFLATKHGVAANVAEAGALALAAGLDVELPDTLCFGAGLVDLVRRGECAEETVDRAVRRVLLQKARLGLLDADWTPERSTVAVDTVDLDSPINRALALEVAEKSIVLLDAGEALPLRGDDRPTPRRIAVVGPCADDPRVFMGAYAFPNHVLQRHPEFSMGVEVPTALEALREELPDAEVVHAPGCAVADDDRGGLAAAVEAARGAEVCIAFVGDRAGKFGAGTSGEGCDAEDLQLPGIQAELLEQLLATGVPLVVVVVSGRPYALGSLHGRAAALVQAFQPGQEGGRALAGILSGRTCPGGKLPVQIPRSPAGPQPRTYLQPALGGDESDGITSLDTRPLFPFGHGASYTRFTIGDLRLSAEQIPTDGHAEITVTVRNTGDRAGDEVVQLYLHDPVAQVARPLKMLAGFTRVHLAAGAAADVTFTLHADRTAYTGLALRRIVEPGEIRVLIGSSSADLPCQGSLRLTGPQRSVGRDRRTDTPVVVREHPAGAE